MTREVTIARTGSYLIPGTRVVVTYLGKPPRRGLVARLGFEGPGSVRLAERVGTEPKGGAR